MNDNTEYWKELFGDDYNEDLARMLNNPSQAENQDDRQPQGDDGSRFRQYEFPQTGSTSNGSTSAGSTPVGSTPAGSLPSGRSGMGNVPPGREIEPDDKADDFNVDFDFDGEYRDLPDDRPVRPRREKRSGCLGGIIYAVFIICVCLLLASLAWLAATDVLGLGNEDEKVQVTIPQDFTIDEVADILHKNGLIKYEFLFKLYADFSEAEKKITTGTFWLNKNYDYRALVNGMNVRGGKRVEIDVVIPEGYTLKQIFELFEVNGVCTEKELWDAAANYDFKYSFLDADTLGDSHRLEGYLFPDTYRFFVGDNPSRAIEKMLKRFNEKFTPEYITRAAELGYSVRDIITIASMIEKEAGNDDTDRDLIASVIYNRLGSNSLKRLQIDATIYYAIAETGEAFSTDIDSPYNTYVVEGLPAGPISNPGVNAIRAALYPVTSKYYYYAANKNGTHNFFKDFESHQAFVNSDEYGG
jgi:UPF0755 protein